MTDDLDCVIQRLESELKNKGIKPPNYKNNNYLQENKEKEKIFNGGNTVYQPNNNIRTNNYKYEINEVKNDLYEYISQIKLDMKKAIDNLNSKIFYFEKELLKINIMNDNLRDNTVQLSQLENDYKLFYKEFLTINSISLGNKGNIENITEVIKGQMEENNKTINGLKLMVNNVINRQSIFEQKYKELYENSVNNENKIINKINELYKTKENDFNILSNNLFSKINDYSNQAENKFESINNIISDIKSRLDSADNNVNLLNDIPGIKAFTTNINEQVININSKIEEITKEQKDINNNNEDINNSLLIIKNDIKTLNNNIEDINKANDENKNINEDLNEIKKNFQYMEKKINNLDTNFNELDSNINDNKNEIRLIKKNMGNINQTNNFIPIEKAKPIGNTIDNKEFYEEINKLNKNIKENSTNIKDIQIFYSNKLKEIVNFFNDNLMKLDKKVEDFNQDQIGLIEENQQLTKYLGNKMIENDKEINNLVNDINSFYQKFEVINNNFKETNKYLLEIKKLDKIVKDLAKNN